MPEKKKLMLIYPNFRWQKFDRNTMWELSPETICLLAAMVRDIVDVKIVDAQLYDLSLEEFEKRVRDYAPDFVGISVLTTEYSDVLDITARKIKEINKNTVVIAGGVHVTTNFKMALKNADVDYSVRGEGEYVLPALLKYLMGQGDLPAEGLVFRRDGKEIVQKRAIVEDISKLPWPAYDLVDLHAYLVKKPRPGPANPPAYPSLMMVPTRGCPFGCSFCQVDEIAGKKVRARDPEDVVDELLFLKKKYGIRSVIFYNDNLLMGEKDFARKLFKRMIEKKLDLKWVSIGIALFLVTDEILDLMKGSGCVGVNVAIESGNERVLREIVNKPIKDLHKVPEIIRKIKDRGIYCLANFIIGLPGETWNEIRDTIKFAENCGADYIKIFVAVPLYGTKLYEMAKRTNAIMGGEENLKVDWRYSQVLSKEWTTKDVSILRAYEWDRINFSRERIKRTAELWEMTEEELKEVRKKTRDALVFDEVKHVKD